MCALKVIRRPSGATLALPRDRDYILAELPRNGLGTAHIL